MPRKRKPDTQQVTRVCWSGDRYVVTRTKEPAPHRGRGERGDEYKCGTSGYVFNDPQIRRTVWFYVAGGLGYEKAVAEISKRAGCGDRTAVKILANMRENAAAEIALLVLNAQEHGLYSLRLRLHRIVVSHILNGGARSRDRSLRVLAERSRAAATADLIG
jgi:hypothetical protein